MARQGQATLAEKGYSRKRIEELAAFKRSKQDPLTSFESKQLRWGDKDSMWTVSDASKRTNPSKRLQQLAQSKKDFKDHTNEVHLYTFSCGRSSPLQNIRRSQFQISDRIAKLAEPKRLPKINQINANGSLWTYSCGRESPIWSGRRVDQIQDRPSKADCRLALPKINHKKFVPNRELRQDGRLSQAWYKKFLERGDAICTERLDQLALPKHRTDPNICFIDSRQPEQSIRPVRKGALNTTASSRLEELAQPNEKRYEGFVPDRFRWPVSKRALKHSSSDRTTALATPVVRPSMEHTQYDPDAFFVKPAAMKAKCSERIQQMAIAIQR